jgi:hypothetical protein
MRDAWVVTFLTFAALAAPGLAGRAQASCLDGSTSSCVVDGEAGRRECHGGSWGPCEPLPPPGPPILARPKVSARSDRSITLAWSANTVEGEQYQLQQQVGTTWTPLAAFLSSPAAFNHTGLQPDTRYCYRVAATGGPHGARVSALRCRYTTDGTGNRAGRVQIRLHTANVEDADTDDGVNVVLTDAVSGTGLNLTWVDYGRDDFERGQTFSYDLDLGHISLLGDITRLRITKDGTNGWCIADLALLVNEMEVYVETFQALPGGCLWLDGDDGHQPTYEVDHARLRAHPEWQDYREPPRIGIDGMAPQITAILTIPRRETESRIEALIGHVIHGTEAHWGDMHGRAYVEADPSSYTDRLSVDLDLEADVNNWFDPELDIDFDLGFKAECSPDQTQALVEITTEALNASVDFDWLVNFLSFILPCAAIATPIANEPIPNCITYLEDYIGERIEAAFQPIMQSERQPLPPGSRCLSADVVVHRDPGPKYGDVDLVFQLDVPPLPAPAPAPAPADFGITCAPASLTVPSVGSRTSVCTVTSANAFSKPVALGCPGLPSGIACGFSPATVVPPPDGSVSSTLTVSVGLIPEGSYAVRAEAVATGTHRRQSHIALTVAGSNVDALTATFDAVHRAPTCSRGVGGSCDTGSTLVRGRGTGGAEPNAPNTIDGACPDGESGPISERWSAIDRVRVSTLDGTHFAPGKSVRVDATVWASSNPSAEAADFFQAADAANPDWKLIGTVVPTASGPQTLSTAYRLPPGGLQAVRVQFRQRTDGGSCAAGADHDRDDLIFAVGESR